MQNETENQNPLPDSQSVPSASQLASAARYHGEFQPLTRESQIELIVAFQQIKDFLSIILMRQNGTIVVTPQQREKYVDRCKKMGFPPHINLDRQEGSGNGRPGSENILVELQWERQQVLPGGPQVNDVLEALISVGVKVTEEQVCGWARQQREQAINWVRSQRAVQAGLQVEETPRPDFLQ